MQVGRGCGHVSDQMRIIIITAFTYMTDVTYPACAATMTLAGIRIIGRFQSRWSIGKPLFPLETDILLFSFVMPFPNKA